MNNTPSEGSPNPTAVADSSADPLPLRILIIDDAPAIHNDFRKILSPAAGSSDFDQASAALFGTACAATPRSIFELESAFQGQEGLERLQAAQAQSRPFALAFVDIRMPPGWDGIETISHLWAVDPDLQVVICTAYSDYSWDDMIQRLGQTDNLVILKKPFDTVEVLQLAHALTRKWSLLQQSKWRMAEMDQRVLQRTQQLRATNERLSREMEERSGAELRLAAFAALGRRLSATQTIGEAGAIISDTAEQLLGWDACFLDLYSKEEDMLVQILSSDTIDGKRTHCSQQLRRPVSPLVRQAFAENGTLILREPGAVPRPETAPFGDKSRPSASILVAPIRNGADLMGVFSIQSYTPAAYDREDLKTLQALADHCGGALDRIRTQESLQATQQQLRQAQKLEAIGQLAGGVAHDFNNLLAVIRGNAELALMQYEGGGREFIDQIIAASDRAANLTRQLLAFSRKQVLQSKPINLNEVIGNLSKMLTRIIGEHIELQCVYAPVAPLVQADVGMIEQVVVNLVVNARDAMPQGGKLRLQIEPVTLDSAAGSSCPEARSGRFICLTVADSGVGIPSEHLPRIFEPFFTTKELGKGTGLGLATAYGIVKQHQGWIEVESRFGRGATIRVLLPALAGGALPRMNEKTHSDLRGGSETILLVEDEEPVRFVTRRLLQQFGYKVHEAVSGVQALELWREHGSEIDLLLTDLLMPDGISGNALAEKLLVEKPALKIIYMSGYGGDIVEKQASFLDRTQGRFLQKPVSGYRLLSSIREFLDQSAPVPPKPRTLLSA